MFVDIEVSGSNSNYGLLLFFFNSEKGVMLVPAGVLSLQICVKCVFVVPKCPKSAAAKDRRAVARLSNDSVTEVYNL